MVVGLPFNKTPQHRVSVPMTTSHQIPIWEFTSAGNGVPLARGERFHLCLEPHFAS
jgi:hypothetical protein